MPQLKSNTNTQLQIEYLDPNSLKPHPRNVRVHPEENIEAIAVSLREFGQRKPIVLDTLGQVIAGCGTLETIKRLGWKQVAVVRSGLSGNRAEAFAIADNKTTDMSHFDMSMLTETMRNIEGEGLDLSITGFSKYEIEPLFNPEDNTPHVKLSERFIVPPFTVLDARQGYWQDRKRAWLALGIQSELGRTSTAATSARSSPGEKPTYRQIAGRRVAPGGNAMPAMKTVDGKIVKGDGHGRVINACPGGSPLPLVKRDGKFIHRDNTPGGGGGTAKSSAWLQKRTDGKFVSNSPLNNPGMVKDTFNTTEWMDEHGLSGGATGTSIFDPVLCELAYRWFSPVTGRVLDPFAGGSVRGIVASKLGRTYYGVDLREEQIAANTTQAHTILAASDPRPVWRVGDSANLEKVFPSGNFDFIFSCPPYGDLEVYSDNPKDISTMPYGEFITTYRNIIKACCERLRNDAFACFVVGDYRDKEGFYRNFVGQTISAFIGAGLKLYNEAILVTAVGSLPIRVGKQFVSSRKLGKAHQQCLVFVKGDPAKATELCGEVEVGDPAAFATSEEGEA